MRPELEPWKPEDKPSASKLNTLLRELQRVGRITVSPPLEVMWGAAGVHLRLRKTNTEAVDETFPAVIHDKKPVLIDMDPRDPINFQGCAPLLLPLWRGEYSFFEVEPDTDPDLPWKGTWRVKEGGRFGEAGKCDAAHEMNRSNANIHIVKMIVLMHVGDPFNINEFCPSSDDVSSAEEYWGSSDEVTSTTVRYWFDLGVPREDCANPYQIAASPLNDIQP